MTAPDRIFLGHTTNIPVVSITRPNDATPYTAGDVIGTALACVLEFAECGRSNGGAGMIMKAIIIDSAAQATQPSLELWLFTAPIANVVDNAPFIPTDDEMLTLVDVLSVLTSKTGSGNLALLTDVIASPFECGAGTQSLYGYLVVRNAYTPVALEKFTTKLTLLQDY